MTPIRAPWSGKGIAEWAIALLTPARIELSASPVLAEHLFLKVRTKSFALYERANAIA